MACIPRRLVGTIYGWFIAMWFHGNMDLQENFNCGNKPSQPVLGFPNCGWSLQGFSFLVRMEISLFLWKIFLGAFNSMRDSSLLDEMRGMLYNLQMFFSPQQSCIHVVEHIKIDQPNVSDGCSKTEHHRKPMFA
jgi:hypothetical protein